MDQVTTGLERFASGAVGDLAGARVGLVTNPTGIDRELRSSIDILAAMPEIELVALYGPEHGIRGEAQAGDHIGAETDLRTGLPIHSLYGATRSPSAEMLAGIDALVVDLQDIGARFTTYISTVDLLLASCNDHGIRLVILDRPNPLGGEAISGGLLRDGYQSFIGTHTLPTVHGMTIGEIALLIAGERGYPTPAVISMSGWERWMLWDDTRLPWVFPSPNLPTLDSHLAYAATCLFEGTNWSEGRGTTRPFEIIGAPWVDPWAFADAIRARKLPGIDVRPLYFTPLASKNAGLRCGGVQVYARRQHLPHAAETGVRLLQIAFELDPGRTAWIPTAESARHPFIDLLTGGSDVREAIDSGADLSDLVSRWSEEVAAFRDRRAPYLLYDSGQ